MTEQEDLDGADHAGVVTAIDLVNELATDWAFGRPSSAGDPFSAVAGILEGDSTWPTLHKRDLPGMAALARRLRDIFSSLDRGDVDIAAADLNDMLGAHPAHPHLAKHDGRWRLHHHPANAALVPMATAICAAGVARVLGAGGANRLGTCDADACDRVFLDQTKNRSRRFCTTTCQNRVKAAAFRRRRAASGR